MSAPPPPEGIGESVLEAARAAGIGIVVAAVNGNDTQAIWVSDRAIEIFGRTASDQPAAVLESAPSSPS